MAAIKRTLLKFGLIADLQYANINDGYNFNKTKRRYYRNAINLLRTAMKDWKGHDIKFILQLGDVIDGFCNRVEEPMQCLNRILDVFDEEDWPVYNVVGNHELYHIKKHDLYVSRLFNTLPKNNKAFYAKELYPGLKLCVLNTYEISIIGAIEGTDEYKQAYHVLEQNPNQDKNDPTGLESVQRRFVRFNGAVSQEQLDWLKMELTSAVELEQNVIVIGHNPLFLKATDETCLCWNYGEVLKVIGDYTCVVCYICGHDHDNGYAIDQNGIQHITLPGVIEHPDTYATGYVYQDSISIEGRGDMHNVTCPLRYQLKFK